MTPLFFHFVLVNHLEWCVFISFEMKMHRQRVCVLWKGIPVQWWFKNQIKVNNFSHNSEPTIEHANQNLMKVITRKPIYWHHCNHIESLQCCKKVPNSLQFPLCLLPKMFHHPKHLDACQQERASCELNVTTDFVNTWINIIKRIHITACDSSGSVEVSEKWMSRNSIK